MPTFEQVADENQFKLLFHKLDVDANSATATKHSVTTVPTVTLFKDGQAFRQLVGAATKTKLSGLIGKA